MEALFNVSERFSQALAENRGPQHKILRLDDYRAWKSVSSARRAAVSGIGIGAFAAVFVLILLWGQNEKHFI